MLTEGERSEYEELMEGRFTMSGYGPGSEKGERLSELREDMWEDISLEQLFEQGDVEVPVFNRKDPYEDRGYQGHFRVQLERDDWDQALSYTPGFEVDYMEDVIQVEGSDTEVIQEGEKVSDVRTAEDLREVVLDKLTG